jgi:hypothetical protein
MTSNADPRVTRRVPPSSSGPSMAPETAKVLGVVSAVVVAPAVGVEEITGVPGAAAMVMDSVAVTGSSTPTTTVDVPALVGVPEITPSALSVSPAGSWPDCRLHVLVAPAPLVAANDVVYGRPTVPWGRGDVVVMTGGSGYVMVSTPPPGELADKVHAPEVTTT